MAKFAVEDRVRLVERNGGPDDFEIGIEGTITELLGNRYHVDFSPHRTSSNKNGWYIVDDCHIEIIKSKGVTPMSVVSKIRELALDADTKLLKKYNIVRGTRELTGEGEKVLMHVLFEANKTAIVAKVKELEANEKKDKKQ